MYYLVPKQSYLNFKLLQRKTKSDIWKIDMNIISNIKYESVKNFKKLCTSILFVYFAHAYYSQWIDLDTWLIELILFLTKYINWIELNWDNVNCAQWFKTPIIFKPKIATTPKHKFDNKVYINDWIITFPNHFLCLVLSMSCWYLLSAGVSWFLEFPEVDLVQGQRKTFWRIYIIKPLPQSEINNIHNITSHNN